MSSKNKRIATLADVYKSQDLDGSISRIRLSKIKPSEEQPRIDRKARIDELAISLKTDGLLSPLIVTKTGENYRIIAGERRYHAACKLDWEQIECRVISRKEQDYFRIAIIENIQRENLSPEEEAISLSRMKKQEQLSDAELASLVGKSRNYITEILGIAQLPEKVLTQCYEYGIHQRNMLIQVVQSYKKGKLDDFFQNYSKGDIKTIRNARLFNQGSTIRKKASIISKNNRIVELSKLKFSLTNNTIVIECSTSAQAQDLLQQLQKNFS